MLKYILIPLLGIGAFVGLFYVIANGQQYEQQVHNVHFDQFYEAFDIGEVQDNSEVFGCKRDVIININAELKTALVFFDPHNFATVEFEEIIPVPEGRQYRSSRDTFTIVEDGESTLIVEGRRIADGCVRRGESF